METTQQAQLRSTAQALRAEADKLDLTYVALGRFPALQSCKWTVDGVGDLYLTSCNVQHSWDNGIPERLNWRWKRCPYCGGHLEVVKAELTEEE